MCWVEGPRQKLQAGTDMGDMIEKVNALMHRQLDHENLVVACYYLTFLSRTIRATQSGVNALC